MSLIEMVEYPLKFYGHGRIQCSCGSVVAQCDCFDAFTHDVTFVSNYCEVCKNKAPSPEMVFERRLNADQTESVVVHAFESRCECSPEFLADTRGVLSAEVTFRCANGEAVYRIVDWNAERRLFILERIHTLFFTPLPSPVVQG